jgi:hypothetical protein
MSRIGLGEHGIVEVARILAVDGDQRCVAQVEPLAHRGGLGALGFLDGGVGELDRDVVGGDGNQADGARIAHGSHTLDHARPSRQRSARRLDPDDVARLGAVLVGRPDVEAQLELAVGGVTSPCRCRLWLFIQAEDLRGPCPAGG